MLAQAQFWGESSEGALVVSCYKGRAGGQLERKVSPPQLRQSQPRGAGLAAGRPRCGHIWGTAAGPGPEQVTWHRQDLPGASKAKTLGGAVVNMQDRSACEQGCPG